MKYLIKNVHEIEIEIEADSLEDAKQKQFDPEYLYTVYAVMGESGKDLDAPHIDQMIFKVN